MDARPAASARRHRRGIPTPRRATAIDRGPPHRGPVGAQPVPGRRHTVELDAVAAVVEVMAGPHRLVSLVTAEAVRELGLKVGDEVVCIVKATNVHG